MTSSLSEGQLSKLSTFVADRMGLHFPRKRWRDLERGVKAAAPELGFEDSESYMNRLLSSTWTRSQIEILAGYLTVGETYFFRDRKIFQVIEELVLPPLICSRRESGKYLRIWSAGCSTGEEPYSIAILLSRMFPDLQDWNITILATDINTRFLQKAADGVYGHWSFRDVPPGIKEGFFNRAGDGRFEIVSRIRKMVTFSYLNLVEDTYPSLLTNTNAMDIIFCRNVLMYFVPELVQKTVHNLHRSLVDGGWLIVSPSESSSLLSSQFAATRTHAGNLYRKERQASPPVDTLSCKPCEEPKAPITQAVASILDCNAGAAPEAGNMQCLHQTKARNAEFEAQSAKPETQLQQDLYREALVLYEEGCYAEAIEKTETLLLHNPAEARAMAIEARIYANLGLLGEALKWCNKAIAAEKLDAGFYYLMATILHELGQTEAAILSLKRTLYLDPSFILAYVTLGNITRQCGKHEESLKHFKNALSLLATKQPEDMVPESEGMNVGRLMEIIRTMQRAEIRR